MRGLRSGEFFSPRGKTAPAASEPVCPYFKPDPALEYRLSNGLKVLLKEDHTTPIVTSMIWYRVGTRNERPGVTGISHFLEHMMFKGTDRYERGDIDYLTMVNGGSNNAFTSHDYTAYYFTFSSDRWEHALDIEANRMRHNLFASEEFRMEKQVIIEELKMDLDNPWGALRKAVDAKAFRRHPYRFPVIGRVEDLRRLTLQQLRLHYRTFYNPGNATLVVVGDFDAAEALARIRSIFESISPEVTPSTRVAAETQQQRQRRVSVRMPGNVARMLIAFRSPPITSPDIYAISLIDKVLSEGKLSRLFQRLVEQEQVMSSITTEFTECIDPHLFYIRGELNPGADPSHVEAIVFEELEKLQREPVSREEWKRAQNQLSNQYLSGFETTMDQAVQYGMFESIASHRLLESYLGRVQSVTPDDIQRVVRAYLQRRKSTVGFVAP